MFHKNCYENWQSSCPSRYQWKNFCLSKNMFQIEKKKPVLDNDKEEHFKLLKILENEIHTAKKKEINEGWEIVSWKENLDATRKITRNSKSTFDSSKEVINSDEVQ